MFIKGLVGCSGLSSGSSSVLTGLGDPLELHPVEPPLHGLDCFPSYCVFGLPYSVLLVLS